MKKFSKLNIPKGKFAEMSVKTKQNHKRFILDHFAFFFCFCEAEGMI